MIRSINISHVETKESKIKTRQKQVMNSSDEEDTQNPIERIKGFINDFEQNEIGKTALIDALKTQL
jgi:t-SNARE complex subunit (syntaxin)